MMTDLEERALRAAMASEGKNGNAPWFASVSHTLFYRQHIDASGRITDAGRDALDALDADAMVGTILYRVTVNHAGHEWAGLGVTPRQATDAIERDLIAFKGSPSDDIARAIATRHVESVTIGEARRT